MYHITDKNDETLDEFSIMMATLYEGWLQITGTDFYGKTFNNIKDIWHHPLMLHTRGAAGKVTQ